jgi:ABC-type Zn uptake system ZnuABC Zn-binding protein ZnuA
MISAARTRSSRTVALVAAAALALSACGSSEQSPAGSAADGEGSDKLTVVTTVSPITNIVANVAGDKVDIVGVVPEGTNSHTFEPPPSAAKVLSNADVVFLNGLKLEDPTAELAEANKKKGSEVVELGTTVLPESEWIYDFSFPKEEGKPNPHLWTDPTFAIKYAAVVRDTLSRRDGDNAATYAANFAAFEKKTNALADAIRADQKTIKGEKVLLTYHDAYAYFAENFGWRVLGAVQPKDFEDPTPKEVAALIDQIRAEKVPTIFGSEVFPSKILEQIGRESGARYEDTLRDDDLPGKPGDPEHSWLGLMRYDYRTMVSGLGGTPTQLDALDVADVAPDKATYPQ